jgi:hypothetical protein
MITIVARVLVYTFETYCSSTVLGIPGFVLLRLSIILLPYLIIPLSLSNLFVWICFHGLDTGILTGETHHPGHLFKPFTDEVGNAVQ